jgi:hypothetical protein
LGGGGLDNERIINMDSLKAIIIGFCFSDAYVKNTYDEIKSEDKTINIKFVNSKLVYGIDHIL